MAQYLFYLLPIALLAVAVVLVMGLISFTRDGAEHRRRSNRLMQWRVALQFVAVVVMGLVAMLAVSQ